MRKVSNEFINLSKKVKIQDLKLTINDGELIVQEVHLMPVNLFNAIPISRLRARKQVIAKELKYSFEGQLFKTIMQQIEITVKNASAIKGKNVDFQYGIQINNEFEYVNMGEYYIKDVEDDKNKEALVVTGYDKMLNFMKTFKQTDLQLTYPCKMSQLVNRMGEVCGVELYSTDFFNSDLIVNEDFFTAQELTYRDVLEKVAQATLTTIFIKENKLFLCEIGDSVQTLDTSFLSNLVIGESFGPVNALVLGRGHVEDNIESIDKESINTNGRCEIRFDENEFLDSKREEVIDLMLKQINGLKYYVIEASNLGLLWLEPCDVIIAKDREENEYKSIYLKANVTINTGIKGEMEADIPDTTTTEYKVTTKELKKTLKVERLAKKNEGLIQDVVEEIGDRTKKKTTITQDVDRISQRVENMADVTDTVEGNKIITLQNCVVGSLLELHIYGNNSVFKHLHPSDTLYPSDDLYPYGDSKIEVSGLNGTSEETTYCEVYDLGITEVLRQNTEVCDEYVLKDGKAKIIRRVNTDGTSRATELIEDLGDFSIPLKDVENVIEIKNYTAKMEAKFAIQNDYTNIFATKVEMSSSITQTAEEINSEVRKKVDENEVCSVVSQSAEEILLKGNRVLIESDNFVLNKDGTVTCKNANIIGGKLNISSQIGENRVRVYGIDGTTGKEISTRITPNSIDVGVGTDRNELDLVSIATVHGEESFGIINIIGETSDDETKIYNGSANFWENDNQTSIGGDGITTPSITQTSLEMIKKNIALYNENVLETIKNAEIYSYNLKSEKDEDKKHIGFVIGNKYKTPKEVIAKSGEGIDTYAMTSILWKAVQELTEKIEKLEGGQANG